MKLVVTGGRHYNNFKRVNEVLTWLYSQQKFDCLVHGGATGADYWCGLWAETIGIETRVYEVTPRCWKKFGDSAESRRNQVMIEEESPDRLLAFPEGEDMVDRCQKAGIPITFSRT